MNVRETLREWVLGQASKAPPPIGLGAEEAAVAAWLRNDHKRLDSLTSLLTRRLLERTRLPVSSTPEEALQREAANAELHAVCAWLRSLHDSSLESAERKE